MNEVENFFAFASSTLSSLFFFLPPFDDRFSQDLRDSIIPASPTELML